MNLASYNERVAAKVIDVIFFAVLYFLNALLAALLVLIFLVWLPYLGFYKVHNYILFIDAINCIVEILSFSVYFSFIVSKYDGTVGKKICRIKLVTLKGEKITPCRAFVRFAAELLSAALFGLGYLIALFDPEKRTLHDRICSTRVVRTR